MRHYLATAPAALAFALVVAGGASAQTSPTGPAQGEQLDLLMSEEFEQMLMDQQEMMLRGGYTDHAGTQGMMVAPLIPATPTFNAVPSDNAASAVPAEGAPPIVVQPQVTDPATQQASQQAVPEQPQAAVPPATNAVDTRGQFFNLSENMIFFRVQFALNSAELMPEALPQLDQLCIALANNPQLNLNVFGHTDATGPAEYNLDLSARRAATVAGYMIGSCGLDPNRLQPVGLGEAAPLADVQPNDAANRRVEFQVII